MDCAEVKVHFPAVEQLEPLVILEEGDELDDFTHISTSGKGILRVKKEDMEDRSKESMKGSTESRNDVEERESMYRTTTQEEEESQQKEYKTTKIEGATVQTGPGSVMDKVGGETEGSKTDAAPKAVSLSDTQPLTLIPKLRTRDRLSPEDAQQKVRFYKTRLITVL